MTENNLQPELSETSRLLLAGDTVKNEYCVFGHPYSEYSVEIVTVVTLHRNF